MIAGVAAAMVISIVVTCVGSIYYCNKPKEYLKTVSAKIFDDISGECVHSTEEGSRIQKEERIGKEAKNTSSSVQSKQQADVSDEFIRDRGEKITSIEWTRRTIFPSNVVPVRPPRRRREISETSSGQFSSIESRRSSTNNESTDANGHGVKTVKAHIEFYPREISSSKEISNSLKSESSMHAFNSETEESTLKTSGERSTVTSLNTKNDLPAKVKTRKTINAIAECENEMDGPSPIVPPRSSCTNRPIMFQINRMVNASTSTKISSHAHELKEFDSEQIASIQEICKRSSYNDEEYNITILREVLSFFSHEEKDCALELSTSRTKNEENGECHTSRDNDSAMITIQIRKYHRMNGEFQKKSKSSLMKMYRKFSGRLETNDKEESCLSSKEPSRTRLSTTNSTYSPLDKSSYYTIPLSNVDRAIFEKKNKKKDKLNRVKKLSKVLQCQKCV